MKWGRVSYAIVKTKKFWFVCIDCKIEHINMVNITECHWGVSLFLCVFFCYMSLIRLPWFMFWYLYKTLSILQSEARVIYYAVQWNPLVWLAVGFKKMTQKACHDFPPIFFKRACNDILLVWNERIMREFLPLFALVVAPLQSQLVNRAQPLAMPTCLRLPPRKPPPQLVRGFPKPQSFVSRGAGCVTVMQSNEERKGPLQRCHWK